ncbi:MAG: hypothetical protein HC799_11185 [Limnothrix sp. RL_2_0]|nr:hypothetical protein [Limnothrix sp. RL_2_0]
MNSSPKEPENTPLKGKEYPRAVQDTKQDTKIVVPENDENITNILANVIAPSVIGGLGAVGLTAIGLNVPTQTVQTDGGLSPTTTVSSRDYLPSMNMSTGTEFFLYSWIIILLATLIGSVGILSLIGVPAKSARSKTWQIGIVYALLFPTAISALIQNQFLGGQQTSVETLVAEQQKNDQMASSSIAEIKQELQKAQQQLRVSTEIIAAPNRYAQPQQNVIMGNQTAIANLDRIQADLDRLNN